MRKIFRRNPDMKLDVVAIIPKWVVLVVTMETDLEYYRTVTFIFMTMHYHHNAPNSPYRLKSVSIVTTRTTHFGIIATASNFMSGFLRNFFRITNSTVKFIT